MKARRLVSALNTRDSIRVEEIRRFAGRATPIAAYFGDVCFVLRARCSLIVRLFFGIGIGTLVLWSFREVCIGNRKYFVEYSFPVLEEVSG